MQPSHDIEGLFAKLANAAAAGDVAAYRELVNGPDPFQEELFLRNSLRLREHGLHMALRHVDADHDTAQVYFDIMDSAGQVVEHGSLTVVQATLGWLIEEL